MAIANTGSGDAGNTNGTSHSTSITIPSGSDVLIVSGFAFSGTITGATIDGNAMTLIDTNSTTSVPHTGLFCYLSPPIGSKTLVINSTSGVVVGGVWASYSGVKQSDQPDSNAKNQATGVSTLTFSTTVVDSDSWLIAAATENQGNATAGTGTTQRVYQSSWGNGIYDSNTGVASGSRSLVVNFATGNIAGVIASFKPAPSASNSNFLPNLLTLGVG